MNTSNTNDSKKDNSKKGNGKGKNTAATAAAPAPVVGAAASNSGAPKVGQSAKPPVVFTKKMPPMIGQKGGRKGSTGIKRPLYGLFGIAYAHFTKFGRFIANGQMKNHWDESIAVEDRTAENRQWIVYVAETGAFVVEPTTEALAKAHTLTAGQVCSPYFTIEENIKPVASFVKNADLADYFTKQAALVTTTNPELAEKHTATAAAYAAGNKYGGFVAGTAADIEKIQENVRSYYGYNPDAEAVFSEIETYDALYQQEGLEPIVNEALIDQPAVVETA